MEAAMQSHDRMCSVCAHSADLRTIDGRVVRCSSTVQRGASPSAVGVAREFRFAGFFTGSSTVLRTVDMLQHKLHSGVMGTICRASNGGLKSVLYF